MVLTVTRPNSGATVAASVFACSTSLDANRPTRSLMALGAMLETTEITPAAAISGSLIISTVNPSSPEKIVEFGPTALAGTPHVVEIARGLFHRIDVGMILEQQRQVFRKQLCTGSPRYHIGNNA